MNDETLKEEIEITVGTFISLKYDVDTDEFADGTLERWNDMTKDIMQLIIQAKIDELTPLLSNVPLNSLSYEYLITRLDSLRSKL